MHWDVSYDYCALLALALFAIYAFSMRQVKNRLNSLFKGICALTFVSIVLDIFACQAMTKMDVFGLSFAYVLNILYLLCLNCLLFTFVLYIVILTENKKSRTINLIGFAPMLFNLFAIITSPWTKWIFFLTSEGKVVTYVHGPAYLIYLGIIMLYIFFAWFLLISYKKKLNRARFIALLLCFVLLVVASVLQFFFPDKLLVGIACTFSVVAIYLGQYNTADSIDRYTEAFNKRAFYLSVSSHIDSKQPFSVIAFEPDGFKDLTDRIGEDKANSLLRQIADFLMGLMSDQAVFKLDGNRFAVLLGVNDRYVNPDTFIKYYYASSVFRGDNVASSDEAKIILQALTDRFDHSWNVGDEQLKMTTCLCYLRYPEDVARADEVNDMIDAALRQAREIGRGTILYAAEYTRTRETYITELQAKQAELEEATRTAEEARAIAEKADNSKTRFLANMSHEIRTPMNAIMGMTELVLRDSINDQVRKNVGNIQSAGNTLLTIINDILDFSKIEAGKMEVVTGSYETASLLNNVLSVSAARLSGKNLDLAVDVDPTIPTRFKGDEMRLRQIIINLMGNAIKYTESGSVTLKVRWARHEDSAEDTNGAMADLIISVIDTGSGIKEEDLNKLFKSFSRIEEQKNHLIEGTGLGLSIVKRLLDLMGGRITVESEYGKGSNFTFTIPQEVDSVISFAHIDDPDSKCVLVYSETASVHKNLGDVLENLGVSHVEALSIDELTQALEARQFTHIFVEYSKYSSVWELLKDLKDIHVVLLMKGNQVSDEKEVSNSIRQPFYCLNVAEALNEKPKLEEKPKQNDYFRAPDAKVLVVDDNAINIQILVGLLQPHRMQVDTAESGRECLKRVQETEYDLILMDHMMPEMDGVETLHAIRELNGDYFKKVPVIVVTANAMSGVQEAMNEAGFQGYISKPINVEKLEDTLASFIPLEKIRYGGDENKEAGEIITLFVPGVNIHKGIDNCGGQLQNYISVLNSVLFDGNKKLQKFEICVRDDDYRTYEIEAHALKGVAAGIGADILSEMAAEQEKLCREGQLATVKINHNRFCDCYRTMLTNIDEAISDSKAKLATPSCPEKGHLNDDEALERLIVIHALLADFEQDVAEKLVTDGNEYSMADEYKSAFIDLRTYMELCRYEDAEQFLKEKLEVFRKDGEK